MKKIYLLMLCFGLLTACQDEEKAKTGNYPEIFSYIPADTPLLALTISQQQYPQAYHEKTNKAMDEFGTLFGELIRQVIDTEYSAKSNEELSDVDKQKKEKLQSFIDKWLFKDSTEKLGFDLQKSKLALYSIDLMPVLRVSLSKDNQMQAFIEDAKQELELPIQQSELDGEKLYTLDLEEMNLQVQVKQPYLTVAVTPQNLAQKELKSVLGLVKPKISLQHQPQQLENLKQKYHYQVDDVFIFDTAAVADYFINPTKYQSPVLDALQLEDKLSPVCKQEITSLIAKAPRIVGGITKMDNKNINTQMVFETDPQFGKDWSQLATVIPGIKNDNAAFYFGFSYDLLMAKNLALKSVKKIADAPFQCEHLEKFNEMGELQDRLSQPLPPFSNNFKGMFFAVDDISLDADKLKDDNFEQAIKSLKMQMLLDIDHAEGLLAMLQMAAPEVAELEIKADGSAVDLTEKLANSESFKKDMPFELKDFYAAMTKQVVGLSLGHKNGGNLEQQVKAKGQKHLLAMGINAEKYKQIMHSIYDTIDESSEMNEQAKMQLEFQKKLEDITYYWENEEIIIDFSEQGLTLDINIEY